jgi:hypothetical protein
MTVLNRETKLVQNPALGAMLLWRFAVGYEEGSQSRDPSPILLLFLVLPIIYYEDTLKYLLSTRKPSGLRIFVGKFSESKALANDQILTIQSRSLRMRNLTMDSIKLAISSSLIALDYKKGFAIPISKTPPKSGIPKSIREMLTGAEKFGFWCSLLSLHEVSAILKVSF